MTDVNQLITENLDVWSSAIEKKSSAGRGNGGGVSLYGITKLRELVLDLAVRGKLVSQCDEEGTGDDLKDAVLKSRMAAVRSKVLRKQKPLPEITDQEVLFAIPPSWALIRLGELTNYGVTDKAEADEVEDDIWVLELEDVEKVSSKLLKRVYFSERRFKSSKNQFQAGDVIYGKLRPYLDKVLVADEAGVCTTEMIPMRAFGGVSPDFVRVFLKSPEFIRYADDSTHGMNLPRLGTEKARMAVVPLPPLAEQDRIVAKVDELMALCDALERQVEDSLEAHQTLVETCLATLTNSQSPAELTQNWTRIEAHFDTLFTTEESIHLLEEAVQELAVAGKLVPQHSSEDRNNQRQLRPDAKAEKFDLKAFEERAKKFVLPEGWAIEPLSRVSSNIVDCPHTTPKWTSEGELCVKSEQIFAGWIDLTNPKYVSRQTFVERIERLTPDEGDILYKREGGILGVGARIPPDTRVCLGQRLMLIRAGQSVRSDFLELVINSPWTRRFAKEKTTGGAAPRVNMTLVRAYPIPIPPLDEQERIVSKVEDLRRLFADMRARISAVQRLRTDIADTLTTKIH